MDIEPPLFLFDGDCGFCRKWAVWLERRVGGAVVFVPYQSIDSARFGLTPEQVQTASYWIDAAGRAYRGNRSFSQALRHGHGGWRAMGLVADLPGVRSILALVYRYVVRNRHRLPAPG